jgi:hypothetical protein
VRASSTSDFVFASSRLQTSWAGVTPRSGSVALFRVVEAEPCEPCSRARRMRLASDLVRIAGRPEATLLMEMLATGSGDGACLWLLRASSVPGG